MVGTHFAAFHIFINRNRYATQNGLAVLHSGHALCNAAGMKYVFCGDVKTNGDGATSSLMGAMASDLVILRGVHGVTSLFLLMTYYNMGFFKCQVLILSVK